MSQSEYPQSSNLYNSYNAWLMLTALATASYGVIKYAEANNRLNYDSRLARIIAGFLTLQARMWHTTRTNLEIPETGGTLIAIGPHRTGWEAIVVAASLSGKVPRFIADSQFNFFPFSILMNMFKVIPIDTHEKRSNEKKSSTNSASMDVANKIIQDNGCVAIFPQGGFSRIGQVPRMIYPGTAKLALANKVPIYIVRLDGFWSIENPIIPLFVRNNMHYRSFFSALHPNNVRPKLCSVINFHLDPENETLTDKEKMQEINAQLYAYFRHTQELTEENMEDIKTEIAEKRHIPIWENRIVQEEIQKTAKLESDYSGLEKPTLSTMGGALR